MKKPVYDDYLRQLVLRDERIQPLEKHVQELERHLELYGFWYTVAYEQNKRYREHLEGLEDWAIGLVDVIGKDYAFHISSTIREALEESE